MIAVALAAFTITAAFPACVQPSGSRITAGDIAAAVPEYANLPADLVLGYAPQPGASRVLAPGELTQWLTRHGVKGEVREPVCVRWQLTDLSLDKSKTAMLASLPSGSKLTIRDASPYGVPAGDVVFPLSGLQTTHSVELPIWRGYVRYADGLKYDVWARVDLKIPFQRVTAIQDIQAGTIVDRSMLQVETGEGPLPPADTTIAIEQVAGRTARRLIKAGTPVFNSALEKPIAVRKGDPVHVSVLVGGARIGCPGVAEGTASLGDYAPIRVGEAGKLIRAQVLGTGQAVLDLSPKQAGAR